MRSTYQSILAILLFNGEEYKFPTNNTVSSMIFVYNLDQTQHSTFIMTQNFSSVFGYLTQGNLQLYNSWG